jgi:hypothetical protein
VPIVFYEILDLATRGKSREIVPLIKSVIEITQQQPDSLRNLPRVAITEDANAAPSARTDAA